VEIRHKRSWFKKAMQKLFRAPVTRFALKISSAPRRDKVFSSLSELSDAINSGNKEKGPVVDFDLSSGKYIIFSDQHKGAGDLADDFYPAKKNYLHALNYYFDNNYTFINLGDCEELWECTPEVAVKCNDESLRKEATFLAADRYYRVFGNHDLEWKYSIQQNQYLKPIFGERLEVYEGILLKTSYAGSTYSIFLTHGHQGDVKSDGNAVSKWIVAAIWTPIQRYLEINLNSLSDTFSLVDRHNIIMSDWSETQTKLVLVGAHTHKPVFASMDHIDRLKKEKEKAQNAGDLPAVSAFQAQIEKRMVEYAGKVSEKIRPHPSYFNTGCCCFLDGDISGIEIENGYIRLIKWEAKGTTPAASRKVLEESSLQYLFEKL
jgi:predicted phosphodiesterase